MTNARALQQDDAGTEREVLPPVLFNTFKHHAGALRHRIDQVVAGGPGALALMATRLAVMGTRLMDLYTGRLSPRALSEAVLASLKAEGRLELPAYRAWLAGQGDYAVVTLAEDGSKWALRLGDEGGRYVHLHPGRWSPETMRVRANVLKTAFLALAHARVFGGDALDRAVVNEVRREHLGLSPIGHDPAGEEGLGAVIEALRCG